MNAPELYAAASMFELAQLIQTSLDVWLAGALGATARRQQALQRLQAIIQFARRAPIYAKLYRDVSPQDAVTLAHLPVISKRELMGDIAASLTDPSITGEELDAFVRDTTRVGDRFRDHYTVWSSSGTSGEPGLFIHDGSAVAVYEALDTIRFRGLSSLAEHGLRVLRGERFALVMVTGGHFAGVSSAEHLRKAFPWLGQGIRPFSLATPLADLVEQLNLYRPTLLATYPTAAEVLAGEQRAGRLRLQLDEMWTGGEFLADCVRDRLAQTFDCRIRNGYGASEFLSIAWPCEHGTLHVNDDWVLLEAVDEAFRPVAPGVPSYTTLLTNLANRVQPLIRYDLGDSITVLPSCPCGSSFPAIRVEGRHDDVLHVTNRDGQSTALLPLVLTTVIEDQAGVSDFQLTQTGLRSMRVALGRDCQAAQERVRAALGAFLDRNGLEHVAIEVGALAPERSAVSGKLRRIVYAVTEAREVAAPRLP
jgi:phenylacetate-coenzyme A ligase PaaK-like adenylate-forming protein